MTPPLSRDDDASTLAKLDSRLRPEFEFELGLWLGFGFGLGIGIGFGLGLGSGSAALESSPVLRCELPTEITVEIAQELDANSAPSARAGARGIRTLSHLTPDQPSDTRPAF